MGNLEIACSFERVANRMTEVEDPSIARLAHIPFYDHFLDLAAHDDEIGYVLDVQKFRIGDEGVFVHLGKAV